MIKYSSTPQDFRNLIPSPTLNAGTASQKRQDLLNSFIQVYDCYDSLFEVLACDQAWFEKAIPLRHPLIFYFGHTAAFYINKLITAQLISERINPTIEAMVAIGVDEMSWDDLDESNYNWPSVSQVKEYRQQVRSFIVDFIQTMPLDVPVLWDSPAWVILMGIEHERIHLETSSVLIRQLPLDYVRPDPRWPLCPDTGPAPENQLLPVQGEIIRLGKDYDADYYGWDNEYGQCRVQVDSFLASEYLVSNREFLAFIEAGGYDTEKWWSDEGWAWATFAKARHPEFWVVDGEQFLYRAMLEQIPMPWNWPVDVNCHEAQAFCRWKSDVTGKHIQLPTEAEYACLRQQLAGDLTDWTQPPVNINLAGYASSCPVDRHRNGDFCDIAGNVWQWSSSAIDGFDGFRVHPCYDDFSTPTFDGKHNLIKGGSWISTGNCALQDSRYAFRRHFFQHAGFRYVESHAENQTMTNPYETDALVSQYLEFHYGPDYFCVPNYPKACASLCSELKSQARNQRALDLGCSVGRTSFELARWYQHVDGIDFSARFIAAATELQKNGKVRYYIPTEGELGDYRTACLKECGLEQVDTGRILFSQGDACNLKPKYCDYDLIFAGNLIDRLHNPTAFLSTVHERLRPGGLLVITSPYTWLEEYTPKEHWLGGYRENGEAVETHAGLRRVLGERFEELAEERDIPFVIRETARKHQHSVAHCTVWRKKKAEA